jgi:hypothetical protein
MQDEPSVGVFEPVDRHLALFYGLHASNTNTTHPPCWLATSKTPTEQLNTSQLLFMILYHELSRPDKAEAFHNADRRGNCLLN